MNKTLLKVFEVYVFVFAFLFASKPPNDADVWFHLNTGEYIVQHGIIPRTEFSSFTHFGAPFIAHGWLSGLIFYLLFKYFGLYALTFVTALAGAFAFWILFRHSRSHPFIAGFITLLGVWAAVLAIGVRPRVFTLLLATIFLVALRNYARSGEGKAVWWLAPLMTLWVNLHGGYLLGFALIGFTIMGIPLDAWAVGKRFRDYWPRMRTLVLVLLACGLFGLINPYGLTMYTFPLRVLSSPVFQEGVIDWLSPNFHLPQLRPLLVLIVCTVVVLAASPKRARPSELLLLAASVYSMLMTNRQMLLFVLVAVPLLSEHLHHLVSMTSFGARFDRPPAPAGSMRSKVIAVLLLLPLAVFGLRLRATVYGPVRQELLNVPVNAVQYMRENQVTGNTFTEPNVWGAFVSWSLRSNPVYIDGRDVYPPDFVQEYIRIIRGQIDWRQPFDRYGVQLALIRPGTVLARELTEAGWPKLYEDNMAVLFRNPAH
ncbi:MAG TPA: hypothetical protein VFZ22_11620 [Pyrinomonadaceae bacterium]|nr:hypothetical protein [Pyrinomonadaceae bacterium]